MRASASHASGGKGGSAPRDVLATDAATSPNHPAALDLNAPSATVVVSSVHAYSEPNDTAQPPAHYSPESIAPPTHYSESLAFFDSGRVSRRGGMLHFAPLLPAIAAIGARAAEVLELCEDVLVGGSNSENAAAAAAAASAAARAGAAAAAERAAAARNSQRPV